MAAIVIVTEKRNANGCGLYGKELSLAQKDKEGVSMSRLGQRLVLPQNASRLVIISAMEKWPVAGVTKI